MLAFYHVIHEQVHNLACVCIVLQYIMFETSSYNSIVWPIQFTIQSIKSYEKETLLFCRYNFKYFLSAVNGNTTTIFFNVHNTSSILTQKQQQTNFSACKKLNSRDMYCIRQKIIRDLCHVHDSLSPCTDLFLKICYITWGYISTDLQTFQV